MRCPAVLQRTVQSWRLDARTRSLIRTTDRLTIRVGVEIIQPIGGLVIYATVERVPTGGFSQVSTYHFDR